MSDDSATLAETLDETGGASDPGRAALALVIAWSAREPERVGEVLLVPPGARLILGRGERGVGPGEERASWVRQRPGRSRRCPPLNNPRISRQQLRVVADGGTLEITGLGRQPLRFGGQEVPRCRVTPGGTFTISRQMVLLCEERPGALPAPRSVSSRFHPFGEPDASGVVGESPVIWALREQAAFVGARREHVLVRGESGTGKELVARAVHALSPRAAGAVVARNAATIPESLVDAELFGNVKDYPNPGMPERPGLVGEADGGSLFLDEIAELPEAQQARLLRVLDAGGEYHRLGESRARRADLRLIGATNRPLDRLKHDVLARLTLRLQVPSLNERPSDIPLIARYLLAAGAREDPGLRERFFVHGSPEEPRLDLDLVEALLAHRWTHHVRELKALLWRAMATSPDDTLRLTDALREELTPAVEAEAADPTALTREAVAAALERCEGVQARAWRELGLKNRFQLGRLMKKYGL